MRIDTRAGGLLAAAALLLATATAPGAQSFPRTLDDIKIFGKGETIQMVFSQPFEGTPTEEHRKGTASLSFVGIGSKLPVRELRPKGESFYKQIRVVQNRYSTTVSFDYRDESFSLKNRLHFSRDGNTLTIDVREPGSAPAAGALATRSAENQLLAEMEQKIGGAAPSAAPAASSAAAPAAPAPAQMGAPGAPPPAAEAPAGQLGLGGISEGDFFVTLATMVAALAVMVLVLYGVLYIYKRFFAQRMMRFTGGVAFKQVASFAVGPRQRIVILEINGETIACGVTPSQITFLTRMEGGAAGARKPAAAAGESEVTAGTALAAAGPGPGALPAPDPAKPDPVHQFAELLKQKVRSLKRIN